MQVRAIKKMVHASTLWEVGEVFEWVGAGEPPAELCEKVKGGNAKPAKKSGTDSNVPFAVSMTATQAAENGA